MLTMIDIRNAYKTVTEVQPQARFGGDTWCQAMADALNTTMADTPEDTTVTVTEDKFQALVAAVQCGGLSGELALLTDKPALAVGLTAQQVQWSMQHDWHRTSARCDDGKSRQPLYRVWVRGDVGEPERLDFTDYEALRAWAGY